MTVSTESVAAAMGAGIYALPLEQGCIKYGITDALEKAHLLAQVAHESDNFRTAQEYASGRAYEGRKDLGNVLVGDGIKFKGRGLIQCTGRTNYAKYAKWKYGDDRTMRAPYMLEELPDAVDVVFWYWTVERPRIKALALADDLEGVTRQVNGGLNGIADRRAKLARAKELFGIGGGRA